MPRRALPADGRGGVLPARAVREARRARLSRHSDSARVRRLGAGMRQLGHLPGGAEQAPAAAADDVPGLDRLGRRRHPRSRHARAEGSLPAAARRERRRRLHARRTEALARAARRAGAPPGRRERRGPARARPADRRRHQPRGRVSGAHHRPLSLSEVHARPDSLLHRQRVDGQADQRRVSRDRPAVAAAGRARPTRWNTRRTTSACPRAGSCSAAS